MELYEATSTDGAPLFGSNDPQEFRDMVCAWLDEHPADRIIELDNRRYPAPAFPYTAWRRVFNEVRGSMHATREQAIAAKD